ncbi:sterol desaturase family protein [Leptospira fluminis]|uniref:Sterol desaturase family protein n=1 Tax=Leptospira fluminis TaxID=2484979 RepID=A0A4R9GRC9_9LEPT|nr:sterol desaturase family protein [Leptospira fluminis]TGK18976.1 sterol desaturase family protein [Leptospira fluminis]
MDLYLSNLFSVVLNPIRILFVPSVKIYWAYLASSVLITLFLAFWRSVRRKGFSVREYLGGIFSGKVWFHKSALVDYKYYFLNTILFPLSFGYFVVSAFAVASIFNRSLVFAFGSFQLGESPSLVGIGMYSVAFWLMNDFGRSFAHWTMHKNSYLWEFHKFHHSAEVLNPLTVYRVHPIEGILVNSCGAIGSGLVTGIATYLYPQGITMTSFLGVNAGVFVFNLYANLRHSHVSLHFPKWLSHIILSPAQHQIHHSKDRDLQNMNLGVTFAIWDLIWGSLHIPDPKENESTDFGLKNSNPEDYSKLTSIYLVPFRQIYFKFRKSFRPPLANGVETPSE